MAATFMIKHGDKAFNARVTQDILVGSALGLVGGAFFRYWHHYVYKPTCQDYHRRYEEAYLEETQRKFETEVRPWLATEKPQIENYFTSVFDSLNGPAGDSVYEKLTSGANWWEEDEAAEEEEEAAAEEADDE